MIESEKIQGIYVIPSYENSLLWFGVLFVRTGIFAGAVLRFNILLPDNFPDSNIIPSVVFQNEVFHPMICPYTGTCDISFAFPEWRKGVDHIWQIVKLVQYIFVNAKDCLKLTSKYLNQESADILLQDTNLFISKVNDCIEQNKEKVYDPPPSQDPHYITFEMFKEDIHKPVLEKILSKKDIVEKPIQSGGIGLSWVKEGEFKALSKEE